MNADAIWWGQIGNSLRLLSAVTDAMRDGLSAVLHFPSRFPWRERFYEQIDLRREGFSMDRGLKRLPWQEGADPGAFVLEELCSQRVRTEFWPGQPVAEYLGGRGDLELCDYFVWIRGIRSREDLAKWIDFVILYDDAARSLERSAVFLLEYDGPPCQYKDLHSIAYQVERYDCHVFCLELASLTAGDALRSYCAELALSIGRNDPEFCAALLETGDLLPRSPMDAIRQVVRQERDSAGLPFPEPGDSEAASAVWRAAVVLLFPVMERFRFDFITRHQAELARYLPISNSNGEEVTEPFDLEIGALFYVVRNAVFAFTPAEVEQVSLCREVRNQLAHNKPVPCEDVEAVMNLVLA